MTSKYNNISNTNLMNILVTTTTTTTTTPTTTPTPTPTPTLTPTTNDNNNDNDNTHNNNNNNSNDNDDSILATEDAGGGPPGRDRAGAPAQTHICTTIIYSIIVCIYIYIERYT